MTNICFDLLQLNHQISGRNFIGCLLHYFMIAFIFVSVDSLQPMLLQHKFQINPENHVQNFKNVLVIGADIVVKLIAAPIYGYLTDKKGRVLVNLIGICSIVLAMFLMPFCQYYYQYIMLRCFYAQGAIAIVVIPLLADYIHHKRRGRCAALLIFISSLGAVCSAFINFTILSGEGDKLHTQYTVISLIILVVGLGYTLGLLKKGNLYYLSSNQSSIPLVEVTKYTFMHPQLSTSFFVAFLARSDSILLSLYLVLWTYSYHQYGYEESSSKAAALSGITYTIIMFACIVYGFLYENRKYHKRNIMVGMLFLCMIGAFSINLSTSIDHIMTYTALVLMGMGISGLLTSTLYLVNEYSLPQHRGYTTGIQTIFGVFGIILQTVVGGILFEYWNRNGPFNYFGMVCFLGIVLTLYLYGKKRSMELVEEVQQQISMS